MQLMPPHLLYKKNRPKQRVKGNLLQLWKNNRLLLKLKWQQKRKKDKDRKKKERRKKLVNLQRIWLLRLLQRKLERRLKRKN